MYDTGTILKLKEPKPDIVVPERVDPDNPQRKRPKHKVPFAYNRVRVLGESPIDYGGGRGGTWEGQGARGVLIEPLSAHGSTLDEPFGKLQKLYEVESVPDNEVLVEPVRVVRAHTASAGPTPEEVFAADADARGLKQSAKRERTPFESPLPPVEPDPDPNASPLGNE